MGGCLKVVLLGVLILILIAAFSPRHGNGPAVAPQPPPPRADIGDEVTLNAPGVPGPLMAEDDAWEPLHDALAARDQVGLDRLMASGKVFRVSNGTRAKLIKAGFVSRKVRILDGPHAGRAGWIESEFVRF
jgi:hypothetical protein